MDDESALQSQLHAARAELRALESELPTFVRWRDEHQARVDGARAGKAPPSELAKATGQLVTAREILSQHEGDVQAAREHVEKLECDLERFRMCERVRQCYFEIQFWSETWSEELFGALNSFIESAMQLGAQRYHFMELHAEARQLRERLAFGVELGGARAALYAELGIVEPDGLRDYSPATWLPRNMTAPLEPVQAPVVTSFERILVMQRANPETMRIRPRGDRLRFAPGPPRELTPLNPMRGPSSTAKATPETAADAERHEVRNSSQKSEVDR